MQIGSLRLKNNIFTAPMAGITTRAFRDILRAYGAGLTVGEMISAQALVYNNSRTWQMLDTEGEEAPVAVQLVGSQAEVMAEAAGILLEKNIDLLDINMGCPAPKITKNGEGASLLLDLDRAESIAHAVVRAAEKKNIPVTVKLRLGWDEGKPVFTELIKRLEGVGICAVTVHGRYRQQFYAGKADRQAIAQAVKCCSIPVIGNGDICKPSDAQAMLAETGCAGIMIGRGLMGNPSLVDDTAALLAGKQPEGRPAPQKALAAALYHLKKEIERAEQQESYTRDNLSPETYAVRSMRTHIACYIKGFTGAPQLRERLNKLDTFSRIENVFFEYMQYMQEDTAGK